MSASTAAEMKRRRRRRVADAMTVSSTPTRAAGTTLSGSSTACRSAGSTADHTVCQPTPKRRASPATDAPDAPKAPTAWPTALSVSTRRAPARPDRSVQALAPHPLSGHAQTRLSPQHPHRHAARRRSIAQHHHAPPLGPGPDPAHTAGHRLPARRLHLHNRLAGLDALSDNRQPKRAETHNRTSLNHQAPPDSWTM